MGKSNKISQLGYSVGSPYRGRPFLNINTPEGLIDMSNTDIPLIGMDETGMEKMMLPFSGMHKFRGTQVTEIPMKKGGKLTQKQYLLQRGLRDANNKGDFDNITPNQAREILHKKKVNGKPLTSEQNRLFGYLSEGHTKKYKQGGMTAQDMYEFLFEEDEEEVKPEEKPVATAPSEEEIYARFQKDQLGQQEYDQTMALAMESQGIESRFRGNNNSASGRRGSSKLSGNVKLDPTVVQATNELLEKFPNLQITSTIRNWGDKDAHPVGRAIDVAGPDTDAAWEYYKNTIVPKYKFRPALPAKHGTGKHIHVGHYLKGGLK